MLTLQIKLINIFNIRLLDLRSKFLLNIYISYLAKTLSSGLRLIVNMIDNLIFLIFKNRLITLLILSVLTIICGFLLFLKLSSEFEKDLIISLSLFPVVSVKGLYPASSETLTSKSINLDTLNSLSVKGYPSSQVYENADKDKFEFIKDNKGISGIYMWTHKDSGKKYVGSSIDLSKRFNSYYSLPYLVRRKNSYICNALFKEGYSSFSITILEIIDTSKFSKDHIKDLILEREQYYINNLMPEYNILKTAGNSLGYKHLEETILRMSGKNNPMSGKTKEKNPFFGKTHSMVSLESMRKPKSEDHKLKIAEANLGKNHSEKTRDIMSNAKKGNNHPMYGKVALNAKSIYIYSLDNKLIKECSSISEAAKWLNTYPIKINNYLSTKKAFDNKYIIRDTILI